MRSVHEKHIPNCTLLCFVSVFTSIAKGKLVSGSKSQEINKAKGKCGDAISISNEEYKISPTT